jgi:hypothetical protein
MVKMANVNRNDLDDLFAAARAAPPNPSGYLMSRVISDAEAESLRRADTTSARKRDVRRPRLDWLHIFLQGGVVGGLLSATLVGVWVGFAQPVAMSTITQSLEDAIGVASDAEPIELIPPLDPFSQEG